MEGFPKKLEAKEEILKPIPEVGSKVLLVKESITSGQRSNVGRGEELVGKLINTIEVGKPIMLENGSQTTRIQSIEQNRENIRIITETSVYKIYKLFNGLSVNSDVGSVSLPEDAQKAELKPGSAPGFKFHGQEEKVFEIKIDRDELKDVLIQTGGAAVHIIGNRYVVLARVGQAHVPFYRSSKGTDGKNAREWYPFFGHTGDWIIKGNIQSDGNMQYLPEISKVQRVLNEHLILPDTGYLDKNFNLTSASNGKIHYSIGQGIPITDFLDSETYRKSDTYEEGERQYMREITGYNPEKLKYYNPGRNDDPKRIMSNKWMDDVLFGISKAQ